MLDPRRAARPTLLRSKWLALRAWSIAVCGLAFALAHGAAPPSFAELEAAGARIGEVHVRTDDIFDTDDPRESYTLYRWANALHVQTRPGVIQHALLFKTGDRVSAAIIDETERLLRRARYLHDVEIRATDYHDGVVDIEVRTRDNWTLDPGISFSRQGGANSSGISLREYNLLGTGTSAALSHFTNVDRSGNELSLSHDRAFGTWTAVSYTLANNSDGRRDALSVVHPFYSLDARWAAGASVSRDDRIDATYNAGEVVDEYRHLQKQAEVFGGWSRGRIDGWVQRWSLGVNLLDDEYRREPGRVDPVTFPTDEKLAGPFLRYELIEDRYLRLTNRNFIGRPEFFALGLATTVQLGWASTSFGSSLDALLYSARASRGFTIGSQTLFGSVALNGQYADGALRRLRTGGQLQYYLPQGKRWLFYAAASGDVLTNPVPPDTLLLGGDNGLRGYPLRYQSGYKRALFTAEERWYTDVYPWNLFRLGGAAFVDAGRAWDGPLVNLANPGWLSDLGIGLRIFNSRAAFNDVLHIDLAFPLQASPDIKRVQVLVKAKASF